MSNEAEAKSSTVHENGWISVPVAVEFEEQARAIRAERDKLYRNIFSETSTDERWVGDLGEIVFKSWLRHRDVRDFEWIKEGAAGSPDFKLSNGTRIGVKTVKRQGAPKAGYTAQVTAQHAQEPVDQFFFMSYDIKTRTMWLLGGIARTEFLESARYYGAGEWVHTQYQVREGHEIYNIGLERLNAPSLWLTALSNSTAISEALSESSDRSTEQGDDAQRIS